MKFNPCMISQLNNHFLLPTHSLLKLLIPYCYPIFVNTTFLKELNSTSYSSVCIHFVQILYACFNLFFVWILFYSISALYYQALQCYPTRDLWVGLSLFRNIQLRSVECRKIPGPVVTWFPATCSIGMPQRIHNSWDLIYFLHTI